MFHQMREETYFRRGDISMLFTNLEGFGGYLDCILIGIQLWLVIAILVTFSPEICRKLGATGPVSAGDGIFWAYRELSWAERLRRTMGIDPEICICGACLTVDDAITDPNVIG